MGFLTPWFLGGLAALGVPIAIHLINRERKTVVPFPSLMFLQKIPYKSVRRQKLRHLLLFALRCLAVALLVGAFARPFFARTLAAAGATTGARERIVLLDRSYSMGYGDRWKKAIDAAKGAIGDLASGDRATIVPFALEASAVSEPTADKAVLERALATLTPSSEATKFAPAIKLATQLLEGSNLPRKEVVIISDFQSTGWGRRDELHVPLGTKVTTVDVAADAAPDLAVAQVTADRDSTKERGVVTVAARLTNTGTAPKTIDATLEIGGRAISSKSATVPARGAVQVRFASTNVPAGTTTGRVSIPTDALVANNSVQFTIAPDEAVSVLIVEPTRTRANQSLYLRRALGIGDRPPFRVDVLPVDRLTSAELTDRALIVLDEVAPPVGGVGAKLREIVKAGAGMLLVPGNDVRGDRWPAEWQPLLPFTLGAVRDRTKEAGGTLTSLDYSSAVFEQFSAPHSGDFATARVYRYRELKPVGDSGVIARFDDGAPALFARGAGRGRIAVWTSSLDEYWTDLPLQPVWLPFVHELASHIARSSDPRSSFTAGDALDLSRHGELTSRFTRADTAAELVLQAPSGKRERLTASGATHVAVLREAGIYELRGASTPAGSGRPIAVNVDLAESDLSRFDPQELVAAVTAPMAVRPGGEAAPPGSPADTERRQTIWWYLLAAALIFLVSETVFSNRLSTRVTT